MHKQGAASSGINKTGAPALPPRKTRPFPYLPLSFLGMARKNLVFNRTPNYRPFLPQLAQVKLFVQAE